jgi:sirohydrochlorin cobaltochelatase
MKVLNFCLAMLLASTGVLAAQGKVGTIVVAHGGGEEWNRRVQEVVSKVNTGGPVEAAFLMGPGAKRNPFQAVARRLEAAGVERIVVVPLLISSHSGHYEQIRYLAGATRGLDEQMMHHLHMGGIEPAEVGIPINVTRAIDDAPEAASIIAERARALVPEPKGRALFLVGHGPNESEEVAAWMRNLRVIATQVQALTGFSDVRVGLVQDDAPAPVRAEAVRRVRELIELQNKSSGADVAVVPVLISKGLVTDVKLPKDLEALPIVYKPEPLLPHPALARWIELRVSENVRTAVN